MCAWADQRCNFNLIVHGSGDWRRFYNILNVRYFRYFIIIFFWKGTWPFIDLNKLESPLNQGCLVPRLVEISPVVLKRKILYFINVFLYLFGKECCLNSFELEVWLKLGQWFCRIWNRQRKGWCTSGDQKSSLELYISNWN